MKRQDDTVHDEKGKKDEKQVETWKELEFHHQQESEHEGWDPEEQKNHIVNEMRSSLNEEKDEYVSSHFLTGTDWKTMTKVTHKGRNTIIQDQ